MNVFRETRNPTTADLGDGGYDFGHPGGTVYVI